MPITAVQVQHALIGASQMEVGHPGPVILHLFKVAARSIACEELFRDVSACQSSVVNLRAHLGVRGSPAGNIAPMPTMGDLS